MLYSDYLKSLSVAEIRDMIQALDGNPDPIAKRTLAALNASLTNRTVIKSVSGLA